MIDRETNRGIDRASRHECATADQVGGGLRRQPTQQRSRQRVRVILDAAAELLEEGGYPALSTTAISARANVSVGSIYQFFSNVDSIIVELVRDWTAGFDEIMSHLGTLGDVPMEHSVERIIDEYVDFIRKTRGFVAVYFSNGLSGDSRALDRASNDSLADRLVAFWARRYHMTPSDRMVVVAHVAIHTGDALLAMAFRKAPGGDETIIAETKRAVRSYVMNALTELGLEEAAPAR
ncbi:MAG TPA: TetR/AcrR family transcriptional regulator [Streptosporangiaceae bacterium]|jgi:AcrR family transcriptional regulator